MFSLLKDALSSFLFEETVVEKADILNGFNVENYDNLNECLCDVGQISFITKEFGIIDSKYSFPIVHSDANLQVGNRIRYKYVTNGEGGRRIIYTKAIIDEPEDDECWDELSDDGQSIGTVVKRLGRLITFSNDASCNLDEVSVENNFVPELGDVVRIYMCSEGENKMVLKIAPYQMLADKGVVVKLEEKKGFINDGSVWFYRDALQCGYEPIVRDKIEFSAIENIEKDAKTWRAISVRFCSVDDLPQNCDWAVQPENITVNLVGSTDFGEVSMGSSKTLTLKILNCNKDPQILEDISFRREQQQITMERIPFPFVIKPNSFKSITFTCQPVFFGCNSEVVDFRFDQFQISRRFEMIVSCPQHFEINSTAPPMRKKPGVSQVLADLPENRTYGPKVNKRRLFRKFGKYAIPPTIKNVFSKYYETDREQSAALLESCPILTRDLQYTTYTEKFHTFQFIEQMTVQREVRRLNRDHVFFRRSGDYLELDMPGLAEQRPSLIINDRVIVTQPWLEKDPIAHVGIIHIVTRDSILVQFHESFHKAYTETDCNVCFEAGASSSFLHDAVKKAYLNLGEPILFPTSLSPKESKFFYNEEKFSWYNKTLNREQRSAVVNILSAQCRPLPYIVFGPPGTGKTVTVVEAVLQLMRCFASSRILVAAPSNSAADLLAKRIINGGNLAPGQLVRIYAFSRLQENISEELTSYSATAYSDESGGNESDTAIGWHRITVGTCASLASLHLRSFPFGHFTHIIVDEAGYATEPQIMVPLSFLAPSSGVAVLAGDPKQLGPVVLSTVCKRMGLAESYMSRIIDRFPYCRDVKSFPNSHGYDPRVVGKLTLNYRSVPEILKLPSKLFYNNELEATVSGIVGREAEIIKGFNSEMKVREKPVSILFHGIRGVNMQEEDCPSWFNPQELFQIIQYVRLLYKLGLDSSELGIITPYRKQVLEIRKLLTALDLEVPKIGSVEDFQGQERQVVIMSCVRSQFKFMNDDKKFSLGFVANPKRVNVSLTRARCLLLILGNPHLLSNDPYWRSVISYCLKMGAYTGCDIPTNLDNIAAVKRISAVKCKYQSNHFKMVNLMSRSHLHLMFIKSPIRKISKRLKCRSPLQMMKMVVFQ